MYERESATLFDIVCCVRCNRTRSDSRQVRGSDKVPDAWKQDRDHPRRDGGSRTSPRRASGTIRASAGRAMPRRWHNRPAHRGRRQDVRYPFAVALPENWSGQFLQQGVIWNSGLFGEPTNMGGGKTLSKRDLESIHVPVAYISGDAQDIAFKNAEADFDSLTKIPAFRAYERGVGHGGTYREPNGGEFSGIAV